MIVKDGGSTLERCLSSVAPLVDRIVLGDTGSTDDTLSIAKKFNATTLSIPWRNDFAHARNQVLAAARCDWILVLDADEMLDPTQARQLLPKLIAAPQAHAYALTRRNYLRAADRVPCRSLPNPGDLPAAAQYPEYLPSRHVRLFRRNPHVFFEHCVHEQITNRLAALGLPTTPAPLLIHHFGSVEGTLESRRQKIALYQRLGLEKIARTPDDFEACFQLGINELYHLNQPTQALTRFHAAAQLRPADARAPLYAGVCLLRLQRLAEARHSLELAQSLGERDPVLFDSLGDLYLQTAEYALALESYRRLTLVTIPSPTAQAKQGAAEIYLGDTTHGLARIRRAIDRAPANAPLQALYTLMQETAQIQQPLAAQQS